MKPVLHVLSPGLSTSLQDLGRPGFQRLGIPISGALDPVSLHAANLLVGNPRDTAALEIAYQGPTLAIEADSVRIAVAGASAPLEFLGAEDEDGVTQRLPLLQSTRLLRGQRLRIGALSGGSMAYLAVEGGFDNAPVLGSNATYTRAAIGGFEGHALRAGDRLPLKHQQVEQRQEQMLPALDLAAPSRYRIVLGPQDDYFTDAALRTLGESTYTVTRASDRMGMRLEGPLLPHSKGHDIVSDGTAPGSIQVPGTKLPIILLADRQTTGGYPKIATVISADLPALGRLTPGAKVAFQVVGIEEAEAARRQHLATIEGLCEHLVPARNEVVIDSARLLGENLVSGITDGRTLD